MEELLSNLIAPVVTGIVTLIGIIIANRKTAAVREARQEIQEERNQEWRDRIEAKIDEHNGYDKLFSNYVNDNNVNLARIDERLKKLEERAS